MDNSFGFFSIFCIELFCSFLLLFSFNIYVLSRAFDHICMEKASYKFLIIRIIIIVANW